MLLQTAIGQIQRAQKKLEMAHAELEKDWSDSVSKEFSERYLEEFRWQIAATVRELDLLSQILDQAKRECD